MKLDNAQKIFVIILIVIGSYLLLYLILRPLFTPSDGHMSMMGFASQQNTILNLLVIFLAIIIGFLVYYFIKEKKHEEIEIVKKVLSKDERLVINEIQKAGEITQDSLRFRLNWSKAKVSAILGNLDRVGLIQRQREGKTYKVFLQRSERSKKQ